METRNRHAKSKVLSQKMKEEMASTEGRSEGKKSRWGREKASERSVVKMHNGDGGTDEGMGEREPNIVERGVESRISRENKVEKQLRK